MKIVADNNIPFLQGALEPFAEVVYIPGSEISRDVLIDADALLIRTRTKCNEAMLNGTNVKFIGTATIGFDHIDTEYCEKNKIKWTNAPGCNSSSVQQYITAALLKVSLKSKSCLKDKTLGIIGAGNVGTKVQKIAEVLGMNILLNDPPRARVEGDVDFTSLKTILKESDIITVHVPLNMKGEDCTYHLFNDELFRQMKNGAWFFNTSRGEVADTAALKKALEAGKPAGAVLDVWENEPRIDLELLDKAFITTPHIAGYSTDGKANGTSMVVNYLAAYFNLPLKNWYPENIPEPQSTEIEIDCKFKSDEDILREAVFTTYRLNEDITRLRIIPSDFERQRAYYPLRREFPSYTITLKRMTNEIHKTLSDMGFKISG
jgi:erythronate-4-phosphate dehydrogenase